MRNPALSLAVAATLVLAASCTGDSTNPTETEILTVTTASNGATPAHARNSQNSRNFRAHAQGGEEVPPVDTRAQGQAIFQLSRDGDELSYKLIVANITDVLQAHIHQAPAGENGPVVAWLYPDGPPPELIEGRIQGVLAEGVITSDDLVGPLEGAELAQLIEDLRTGNAYVNVHTEQHPAGEVRGQIH